MTTYQEAVNYILDIPKFAGKHTLEETGKLLAEVTKGGMASKVIHIAGTNGKGSVCAYLRAILEQSGRTVGMFTSPHLVSMRERIMIGNEMISREDFVRIFEKVRGVCQRPEFIDSHPSFFEFVFLMAMVYFGEKQPDYIILETGLGGRLDATNSVSAKELAVITHISLDHGEYLGDTVGKIAGEKAGIMQAGVPVVYWDTCEESSAVFREQAANLGISAYSVSKNDYSFSNFKRKAIDFSVHTRYYNYISLTLRTIATYQMENATLAVRAIEELDKGETITAEQIRDGIRKCFWAGRMEEVFPEVYVDGAHNEDGVRAFLEAVASDGHEGNRSLLFSVVKDKDYERMVEEFATSGLFDRIVLAHMQTGRGVDTKVLEELFANYPDCAFEGYENVAFAFEKMIREQGDGERIYVAGSLYLVGEIKELQNNDKFRRRIEKISSQS